MKVYLDNGATTRVDEEVIKEMNNCFREEYGNAGSIHYKGENASRIMEEARKTIAKEINAEPEEIIFTSGGTESDNMAIKGLAKANPEKKHIILSPIEHHAILRTCGEMEEQGYETSFVPVNKEGLIDLEKLGGMIKENTLMVTIIHGNNEIGTIQDIKKIGEICNKHKVYFHTDAVQSFTKVPIDVKKINIDLMSLSAHKIHGPKGIGSLYVRKGTRIKPLMHGGHQENKIKPGTENVPGMAGFAKATVIPKELEKIRNLRDRLIKGIKENIDNVVLNGDREKRLVNNANVAFKYVEGESILTRLSEKGICVSTGSACTSKELSPSHVLMAIGLKPEDAHGSIRFTLSRYNTKEEIDYTIKVLKKVIRDLRKISPLGKEK